MGNSTSKPPGGPQSPVASHSSNSSASHSYSQKHAKTHLGRSGSTSQQPRSSQPATSSPSQQVAAQQSYSPSGNMGNEQSRQDWKDRASKAKAEEKTQATPVQVPRPDQRRQKGPDTQFEPSGHPNWVPPSNLNFPPRLPLPIEEEVHTPGSPIIPPAGESSVLHEDDIEGVLPRQTSVVSSTTLEDEEDYSHEVQPYPEETLRKLVPTTVRWKQGGDKVYVTGTFTSWSRKFRMNRDPESNILSTVLQLPPGTHHVKFIVDGEMQLSNELPTAVDYTNILVNYVEVSADDLPKEPGEDVVPHGVHPPLVLAPRTEIKDYAPDSVGKPHPPEGEKAPEPVFWGGEMPRYLLDLDGPEQSHKYKRAARSVTEFTPPPSLPLFLGKSILNGTTPMRDDNSVLNMPNHTVLNHLATSSIKNNVLATSVTTRYKRKYVTTMMYKPTEDND